MGAIATTGWPGATSLVTFEVARHRLTLPDTALDLAWVDGRIDVIGPMSMARPSRYAVGTRVVLLSIAPADAASWLGVPLIELTDLVVDLRDIGAEFADRLGAHFEASTVGALVANRARQPSRTGVAANALARGARVAEVADAINLSERQLTRSFHRTTGLHPKRFQRIVRLRRAVGAAKAGMSLSGAAFEAGYADQAHLTREIRALTGATPLAILPNVGNVQDVGSVLG
jgi:AraC-like DNA-binding protein